MPVYLNGLHIHAIICVQLYFNFINSKINLYIFTIHLMIPAIGYRNITRDKSKYLYESIFNSFR